MNNIKTLFLLSAFSLSVATATAQSYDEGNSRAWGSIDYTDEPWVFNVSRPNLITRGLLDRHLCVWQSHGRYYNVKKGRWEWQRPLLFGTTEDLFTQTIVVPYLIPMLENAGATVFTPRERDWQKQEVIVDNDNSTAPYYIEYNNSKKWKDCDSVGFRFQTFLGDTDNPFKNGTLRQAKATKKDKRNSEISYQPNIPESGRYAVYVSYATLPKSVADAKYIVYHQGQQTVFNVNQRMGGGTWVYLGSFDFDKGCSPDNRVVVTNHASRRGVVTSDAVRFGGGMGNVRRGGEVSGLPRCDEGARYSAQWAGVPYRYYTTKKGEDDYGDDINVRSLELNWLAGGSVYEPTKEGLGVPFELSLAVHSDAGYERDGKSITGSLAICTTDFNDGILSSGISRETSKDFARALLHNIQIDMEGKYHKWNTRYLWDRNYSETRLPEVPSAIFETLSHQNFPDMRIIQNPSAKFTLARSIYKTILRYVCSNHGKEYTVEPLAPHNIRVTIDNKGMAHLAWNASYDDMEKSAYPTSYNVFVAAGKGGFDNGTNIRSNQQTIQLQPGVPYRFKVTACNAGGESFPSETVAALWQPGASKTVLVVNGFHRLASPQVNSNGNGFDFSQDPGVPYGIYAGWSPEYIDGQTFIMGNTFDYTAAHTDAIAASKGYNVVSCSTEALTGGQLQLRNYAVVDLILGLERYDGYTPEHYKTFTPGMRKLLSAYTEGGGKLLVSGSYIGSDMTAEDERQWLHNTLKVDYTAPAATDITETVNGLGCDFDFYHRLNERHYAATHPDILQPAATFNATDSTWVPVDGSLCAIQYSNGASAAVGFKGKSDTGRPYATFTMGFPFECIENATDRQKIMAGILNYLTK